MDFTQPWEFGDIIFILQRKKVYANKATLSMSSEVFKAMFTSDFKEKTMTKIPLPDKKFGDFVVLMQAVHPPHSALTNDEMENNVECILPLADEYQMDYVKERCEIYLLTQPPSIHNLILADRFSLPELRTLCIDHTKDMTLQELDADADFKDIESESLSEVYRYKLEPSKEVICDLMTQAPSIKNLLLAEKYNLPQLYDKCLEYVKHTSLDKLKVEPGIDELKPETLNEVLSSHIVKLKTSILDRCGGKVFSVSDTCTGGDKDHYISHPLGSKMCGECAKYSLKALRESLL